jgi:hypothetical protein
MAEIGIEPHTIEAVLNHFSGHKSGVAGVYNKAGYPTQKKHALITWANHIARLIDSEEQQGDQKVIPLRA